ncbi:YveK family protein [Olsenella profusa]|uniref:Lipopolysaccharide biosynthesis protein n=1 Tax=Olsenella profusa TaxID=138595 RepID=A0ABS2F229_9ACTN|nr:Wzz/FepE/Etk N-terminal domain-containing protein [Olsenella profusa]MBM6774930.1 lipopolysaccharide biosynthesis protein [Olsenella profusa]
MTLLELLHLLRKHLGLVLALPVVCALVMGVYAFAFMHNTYTATASMYVLAQGEEQDTGSSNLSTDLNASQMISNDVSTLLTSDRVLSETASDLGLENLDGYETSVTSETTSRVIGLSVTGPDPQTAADIANGMVDNVSEIAREVMNVESVNAIDAATTPAAPSGPNRVLYVAVAFMAGLFAAVAVVVIADMLNTKVRSQEEVEALLELPVIGRIPTMREGR